MKKPVWFVVFVLFALIAAGCDVENKVEEATTMSHSFDVEADPVDVSTGALVCAPLPSLETLLSQFDEWSEIKDHVKEVNLKSVDYKITQNTTLVDGRITLYGGDDAGSVSTDPWGQTDIIEAGTSYPDYQPVDLTGLGRSELQSYLDERDISIVICSDFEPDDEGIDLRLQLRLSVEVVFTAL